MAAPRHDRRRRPALATDDHREVARLVRKTFGRFLRPAEVASPPRPAGPLTERLFALRRL